MISRQQYPNSNLTPELDWMVQSKLPVHEEFLHRDLGVVFVEIVCTVHSQRPDTGRQVRLLSGELAAALAWVLLGILEHKPVEEPEQSKVLERVTGIPDHLA